MNLDALQENELNIFEYGYTVGDSKPTDYIFSMRIPKLTTLLTGSTPSSYLKIFNNNIFINADKCKPYTSGSVRLQNYISILRFSNTNFNDRAVNGIIPDGTKFICCVMDKNPRDIHLLDHI